MHRQGCSGLKGGKMTSISGRSVISRFLRLSSLKEPVNVGRVSPQDKLEPIPGKDRGFLPGHFPVEMNIISAMILDDNISRKELTDILSHRLAHFPRFRQAAVRDRSFLGDRHFWVGDPNFSVERHIHELSLFMEDWEHDFKTVMATLTNLPLSPEQPLWDCWLLHFGASHSVIVLRSNHAVADGVGLITVLLNVADNGKEVTIPGLQGGRKNENARDGMKKSTIPLNLCRWANNITGFARSATAWYHRGPDTIGPLKSKRLRKCQESIIKF